MSLPNFNQPYAIDFHPTDFLGFKTTPAMSYIKMNFCTLRKPLKNPVNSIWTAYYTTTSCKYI